MRIEQQVSGTVRAFHGDPALKLDVLARLESHAQAGEILNRANVWKDGSGSPVACMVHDTNLVVWQEQTGMPKAVGSALDAAAALFDQPAKAARFSLEWVDAIQVGQDLGGVAPALLDWLLTDPEHGLQRVTGGVSVREMIDRIVGLHRRTASGDRPTESEWQQARAAAMATTDGCEDVLDKSIAGCVESAAWNTASSATTVSDTVRDWIKLFGRRNPGQTGWGLKLDREINAWLAQLTEDAITAGRPAPNISAKDLCGTHPAVVTLKRLQTVEIRKALQQDKELVAGALLALTRQSTGASNGN